MNFITEIERVYSEMDDKQREERAIDLLVKHHLESPGDIISNLLKTDNMSILLELGGSDQAKRALYHTDPKQYCRGMAAKVEYILLYGGIRKRDRSIAFCKLGLGDLSTCGDRIVNPKPEYSEIMLQIIKLYLQQLLP